MHIEIPATTEKSRNLQEFLQELTGFCRNVRNLQECQEFAGMSGEWLPCVVTNRPIFLHIELILSQNLS